MKIFEQPKQQEWTSIISRPVMDDTALRATVRTVLDDVRVRGDEAIIEYTEKFDGVLLKDFAFDENELIEAENNEVERSKLLRDNYGGIDT